VADLVAKRKTNIRIVQRIGESIIVQPENREDQSEQDGSSHHQDKQKSNHAIPAKTWIHGSGRKFALGKIHMEFRHDIESAFIVLSQSSDSKIRMEMRLSFESKIAYSRQFAKNEAISPLLFPPCAMISI
jgi:hypothetical protein